ERAARRHELRGTASRAAVLRGAARGRDSLLQRAPRRETGRDRLGAGQVPLWLVDRRRNGEAALRPVLHQTSIVHLRPDDRDRHREGDPLWKGRDVTPRAEELALLGAEPTEETLTVARNVSTRYLAILIE